MRPSVFRIAANASQEALDRRKFLAAATAAAAVASQNCRASDQFSPGAKERAENWLASARVGDFAPLVGGRFRVRWANGASTTARLVEAKACRIAAPAASGRRAPFALLFRSEAGCDMQQDVYRLEHPRLGAMQLLLVPVGPATSEKVLEAVFG